eukprot:s4210_g4.t2
MLRQARKGFGTSSLLRSFQLGKLELQLCLTDDIVEFPPFGFCNVLINPANEALVGTKLPYFPMQVEPPPELRNSRWCGMEAGSSMFYPMQVVDGRVHRLGGSSLREACERLPERSPGVKCPTGEAVVTEATAGLRTYFEHIVHAVPCGWNSITNEYREDEAFTSFVFFLVICALHASILQGCFGKGLELWKRSNSHQPIAWGWCSRRTCRGGSSSWGESNCNLGSSACTRNSLLGGTGTSSHWYGQSS